VSAGDELKLTAREAAETRPVLGDYPSLCREECVGGAEHHRM